MDDNILRHVVVMPDGNRRWARKKGFQAWTGHRAGAKVLKRILEKSLEMNIFCLTFWGASLDNLTKRPKQEVKFLYKVFENYFKEALKNKKITENQVKINIIGEWKRIFPKDNQKYLEKIIDKTKNYNNFLLNFLLAYNGTEEMISCVQSIVSKAEGKKILVDKNLIKKNLWTKDLPPVDLVIRTGCNDDPHISAGFMMWDTAYSQIHFTETLFPDFSTKEFEEIIKTYISKERRKGA